jgi:hypothetical protein
VLLGRFVETALAVEAAEVVIVAAAVAGGEGTAEKEEGGEVGQEPVLELGWPFERSLFLSVSSLY